jgi:peroxisomal 3,2-trans-enoyl-CoA isomerase
MLRRSLFLRESSSSSASYSQLPKVKGLDISRAPCHPNVVTITLSRPRQKNAITYEMYLGITNCFNAFSKDASVGAIVLTGHPDCNMYCSGNDLTNFFQFGSPRSLAADAKKVCRTFVDAFIECEKPIIVGCNGPAIGIAVTTALLADFRFCTEDTTLHTPFKALAQGPEGCSSYLFPKVMGKELAHKMLDQGYVMKADEAKKSGFFHEIIPRPKLIQHCQWTAADIIEGRVPSFKQRASLAEKEVLKRVNFEENEYLEDAWVSEKCFSALEDFMAKKGQKPAAAVFGVLNKTRFLWDKKGNNFKNKENFIQF